MPRIKFFCAYEVTINGSGLNQDKSLQIYFLLTEHQAKIDFLKAVENGNDYCLDGKSVDPDQTPRSAASDLRLHCLLRPVRPNTGENR